MACCAFAVFLLGQLYGLVDVANRWLRLGANTVEAHNDSVGWRPGAALAAVSRRRVRRSQVIYAASFLGLFVFFGTIIRSPVSPAVSIQAMLHDPAHWCGNILPTG